MIRSILTTQRAAVVSLSRSLTTPLFRSMYTEANAATLLLCDPVSPDDTELPHSTRSLVTAASLLHTSPITLLIMSNGTITPDSPIVETARAFNPLVDRVALATVTPSSSSTFDPAKMATTNQHLLAENVAPAIVHAQEEIGPFSHIMTSSNKQFGQNFIGRAAVELCIAPITDVVDVIDYRTFIRPLYAGNALAKIQTDQVVKMMTVRPTAFDKAQPRSREQNAELLQYEISMSDFIEHVGCHESNNSESEVDLGSASIVVSGGRGVKSKENFTIIEALAKKMGAAVGASRAAVDSGFISNDKQVGQTGKVVSPDLYVAVGISGAIQHLSGMKDSKVIVAINKDKEAPIFQVADYGLVGDLFEIVPEMTEKL